jgi:deazaflavin-dependent oxidoreductase (nitroreductase family)
MLLGHASLPNGQGMSDDMDRPVKRRWEILIGRYTANPLMRGMFKLGITPPGMALVETIGRRSGAMRHTPVVAYTPDDISLWLIAQHGTHAGWVRNFQASPQVRVRLGRRWRTGTAELLPDDDVKARIRTFAGNRVGQAINAATFRALESQPVTVRIQLEA